MPLVAADLATAINTALGPPTDKDGHAISATPQMLAYAKAVIAAVKASVLANATGTVQATGANGLAVTLGLATAGALTGVSSSAWNTAVGSDFAGATTMAANASASCTYLQSASVVSFASGNINGLCTSTPTVPGILQNGVGANGKIAGPSGAAWNTAVGAPGPLGATVYSAIAAYLIANAAAAYAIGSVTGVFPAAGGSMSAGTGVGGTIT